MRSSLLIAIVSIVLLALPCALASAATQSGKAACRGTKVSVKVGEKKTCQPFARVFPKPGDVDLRLSYLRQVLRLDPAKLAPAKKRKRIHSLQSGFGAAGRRLQKRLLASLPKALAYFDRKRGSASASSLLSGPALASANCGVGPASSRGSLGGSTSVVLLGDNGMLIETEAAGYTVRVSFVSCGGVDRFSIPECPKADGSVDAKGSGDFRATTEVLKGSRLEERTSTNFEDAAEVHGEVGADAKLKLIKVKHKQEMLIISRKVGGAYRGGMERSIEIQMPGGQYDPASAQRQTTWRPGFRGFRRRCVQEDGGGGAQRLPERGGEVERLQSQTVLRSGRVLAADRHDQSETGRGQTTCHLRKGHGGRRSGHRRQVEPPRPGQRGFLSSSVAGRRADHPVHGQQNPTGRSGQGDGQIHLDRRGRRRQLATADRRGPAGTVRVDVLGLGLIRRLRSRHRRR